MPDQDFVRQQSVAQTPAVTPTPPVPDYGSNQDALMCVDPSLETSYFDEFTSYDVGAGQSTAPQSTAPPAAPAEPAAPPPDPEQTRARATALYRAMDGWGTDEDAIMSTLRGLSAEEVAAVRAEFQDHYGSDLDEMIRSELNDDQFAEADALLQANPVEGVIQGLQNSLGWNDDEDKIEELMRSLTVEQRAELAQHPQWASVRESVQSNLGGSDREVFDALETGDTATAAAIRLDDAMGSSSSAWNPMAWGTDEDAVYEELARLPAEERARIQERFDERMVAQGAETSLEDELTAELGGADHDRAVAVLEGNTVDEQVARLEQTMEGLGTDEAELHRLLEQNDLSTEQRAAIAARYAELHGGSLSEAVASELGGTDAERAAHAIEHDGQMDPAFMMYYAVTGMGTDEDLLRTTLQGMNSTQIAEMRATWEAEYADQYGADFDTTFAGELSGRDHFDIVEIGLRGEAQTDEERAEVLQMQYDYERGERSTAFGRGYMDALDAIGFSSSASQMERQHDRLEAMYDENGQLVAEPGEMERLFGQSQDDVEDYRKAKDSATDTLATVGEITVAAIVTIASDGAASPWLVAALAGLAGGGTGMAIRAGVQGEAYGREAIAADALKTALSAGLAGAMESGQVASRLSEIASNFGDDVAREVAEAALKGGLNGAGSGAIDGAMDGDALRRGVDEYLAGIATNTALGGVSGVASGGVQKYTERALTPSLDRTTMFGEVATMGLSTGAGGMAGTAVNPTTYDGDLEDIAGRFATSGAQGLYSGGLTGVSQHTNRSRIVAREVLVDGKSLADISHAEHLSPEQAADVLARIEASGQTVDAATLQALRGPPATETRLESVAEIDDSDQLQSVVSEDGDDQLMSLPEEGDLSVLGDDGESYGQVSELESGGDDSQAYREELILQELIRLDELGNETVVDQVLAEVDDLAQMESMLLRASGGGGESDLAGVDVTTPEGATQALLQAGVPQSQLTNLEPATLDAVAAYAQAYASGDVVTAAETLATLETSLSPGMLALVEATMVQHHYGTGAAEELGMGPSARAGEMLGGPIESTAAEGEAMRAYMGDSYDTYLDAVRAQVPASDPRWSMLTEAEMVAVYGYTTSDYQFLNPAMRSLDPMQLAELMPYIATAQSGLCKMPNLGDLQGGDATTRRGMDALSPELSAQLMPGMTFTDNAFMSTSMTDGVLDTFNGGVAIEVIGTSGVPISDMSAYSTEQEALYPAGTSFTVEERYVDENGTTHIRLRQQ